MALIDQINEDIKVAMRARDQKTLEALRAIKSALLLETTKAGAGHEISSDVENKLLQKLYKQRLESAAIYKQQSRQDLAEDEEQQGQVIERYMPKQMSREEIRIVVVGIIQKTGATTLADVGKVMGVASKEMAGRADGKTISDVVKEELS